MSQQSSNGTSAAAEAVGHPNQAAIEGLRAMADFLEANPEARFHPWHASIFPESVEELHELARWLGTYKVEEPYDPTAWLYVSRDFGGGVSIQLSIEAAKVSEVVQESRVVVEEKVRVRPEVLAGLAAIKAGE